MGREVGGVSCLGTHVRIKDFKIKKNTFESVLMRWMKLEPIIQSEVSQNEKHQIQYTNTYIWNLERCQ